MRWQFELDLLLHLHLLWSCVPRLLCLSEAEDLGVQVVNTDIMCLWLCTRSHSVILAVMCGSRTPQALYVVV